MVEEIEGPVGPVAGYAFGVTRRWRQWRWSRWLALIFSLTWSRVVVCCVVHVCSCSGVCCVVVFTSACYV
jgi:hypothetical protein